MGCAAIGAIVLAAACAGHNGPPGSAPRSQLEIYDDDPNVERHRALLGVIGASPHNYFRFIATEFADATCAQFAEGAPLVKLHGDAHIEQYAVTDQGRGLTDFDVSAVGPPEIDLVRLAVSVDLALRAKGWTKQRRVLLDSFFRGYRSALKNPEIEVAEPVLASRLRAGFRRTRPQFISEATAMLTPLPSELERSFLGAFRRYASERIEHAKNLEPQNFVVKRTGSFQAGIGSSLTEKYLAVVDGPSNSDEDDVVLEVKHIQDLARVSCIRGGKDPTRVLEAFKYLGHFQSPYLGLFVMDGERFWVQEWLPNYEELSIEKTLRSSGELGEVLYDVGVQLGQGHPHAAVTSAAQAKLRGKTLAHLDANERKIRRASRGLAKKSVQAWRRFVKGATR